MIDSKAFLFDLNGTMIDDMHYHIRAWHKILNEIGGNLSLEQTKMECYGKNNELLERIFPKRFSDEEKNKLSFEKETIYQREFKPNLRLLDGLESFLRKSKNLNIKMAIGSAAINFNIDFVLDNLNLRHYFDGIVSAEDVFLSKPHPETYLKCANLLSKEPGNCIIFEDVPKGVESASNAGMKCIVINTHHEKEEFKNFNNILGFYDDFTEIDPYELIR
jgi:beta-phosphoglucomutase